MKRNVWIFGLVIGVVLAANMVVMINMMYSSDSMKGNDVVGYAAMVVMFSLIFFGVRNYRNKQLGGYITFGKALKMGVLTALVGSTVYVAVWLFFYYLFVPDFMDVYAGHVLKNCSPNDVAAKTAEMAKFKEMYKNPLFVVLLTYMEILPVGLVVALISALVLKRKKKQLSN